MMELFDFGSVVEEDGTKMKPLGFTMQLLVGDKRDSEVLRHEST